MDPSQTWNVGGAYDISRAISHGFEALKRQPLGLLLGAFLMTITDGGGGGGGGNWGESMSQSGDAGGAEGVQPFLEGLQSGLGGLALAVIAGCVICCGIAFFLFRSWLEPGYLRLHRAIVVDGAGELGLLFSGGDTFGRMALWKLLSGVIGLGTAMIALLPGGATLAAGYFVMEQSTPVMIVGGALMVLIGLPALFYVGIGLSLGAYAVALDAMSPMDALERSWAMARGNRFHLFIFFVVTGIFAAIGVLACCVGIFATRAIRDVGATEAYLLATRPESAASFALMQAEGGP